MKTLPDGLAAHIAGEATTLCQCWRVTLTDGTVLGFTDHDRDVSFEGMVFEAASGLSASEATAAEGFSTGGLEVAGAFVDRQGQRCGPRNGPFRSCPRRGLRRQLASARRAASRQRRPYRRGGA